MNELLVYKKRVVDEFIKRKSDEIEKLKAGQHDQLDDANNDDIDSHDLFESTRSQQQDEVSQQSDAIEFLTNELELLKTIHLDEVHDQVTFGSLVETLTETFLIGAAQRQFDFEGKKMIGLSVGSDLFKKMEKMKVNAQFHFGPRTYTIKHIS